MSELIGWVSLWRELYEKPIWANSTPEHKIVLIVLLGLVNHEPGGWEWKGNPYTVKRGQTITSLQSIRVLCGKGVSIQNIRTALLRFEKLRFLTNESTKTGRRITICNYDTYQKPVAAAHKATNKDLTKGQQRGNKGVTPNNKDNNKDKDNKKTKVGKKPSSRGMPLWMAPFAEIWKKAYGGNLSIDPSLRPLSSVIKEYGKEKAIAGFRQYCSITPGQYASVHNFSSRAGIYINPEDLGEKITTGDEWSGFDFPSAPPEPMPTLAPFPGAPPKPLVPPKPQYETVGGV